MDLRRQGYWDEHYELELKNYQEDGDEGDVWFGKGLSRKIVSWLSNKLNSTSSANQWILDVGCGNAYLLYTLASQLSKDLTVNLVGIDYSSNSIELSKSILEDKKLSDRIVLKQCDFLNSTQLSSCTNQIKYNFVIDKGTFDAICLLSSDETLDETKTNYMNSVYSIAQVGTIFILASCNHTESELMKLVELNQCTNRMDMKLIDRIETPKIQFGGKEGSQVTCLIFEFA